MGTETFRGGRAAGPLSRTTRRPRRVTAAAVAVLVAGALSTCSSDSGGAAPTSSTAIGADRTSTSGPPAVEETEPERFAGSVADFYAVPDPLPRGRPGDLVRVQPVSDDGTTVVVRVMYHSRDVRDHDRAVTGTIAYPTGPAPDGGWPVVSWAHGTTGLSSACAPSRSGGPGPTFGVRGVAVATDYIGLGPIGERHPYLSGPSEAHSVIDAVRAARDLPDAHAGTRWLAAGHSQGGHSALWTNELGASYAPELDLLGTAVLAPAAALDERFGPQDQVVPRMVEVMALYGLAADHPEIIPRDYVGPQVAAADASIDEGCADDVINAMAGTPAEDFYAHEPRRTEPAKSILAQNDPGHVAVEAPLLLLYGSSDAWVVPQQAEFLFRQLCDVGQVTRATEVQGATHDTITSLASDEIGAWFAARLAGEEPPDTCPGG